MDSFSETCTFKDACSSALSNLTHIQTSVWNVHRLCVRQASTSCRSLRKGGTESIPCTHQQEIKSKCPIPVNVNINPQKIALFAFNSNAAIGLPVNRSWHGKTSSPIAVSIGTNCATANGEPRLESYAPRSTFLGAGRFFARTQMSSLDSPGTGIAAKNPLYRNE